MIDACALTKRYGGRLAVDGLSFTVRPGVVTGFLGPNGSGNPQKLLYFHRESTQIKPL